MNRTFISLILLLSAFNISIPSIINRTDIKYSRYDKELLKVKVDILEESVIHLEVRKLKDSIEHDQSISTSLKEIRPFSNPAGCAKSVPIGLTPLEMLKNVQDQLGDELILDDRRITYIWNGYAGSYIETNEDQSAFEFETNEFQPPFTYRGDQAVSIFVQNGFAVWFRNYGGVFRLLAIPMVTNQENSIWSGYVQAYWQKGGLPEDETILPVSKKMPCQWMIKAGLVSHESVREMFDLDWHIPDYLSAGRQYLAGSCKEAYRVSQERIGYWDATSMCGPLTWQIVNDANSFPYRIGSYDSSPRLFINANPRYWGARPWTGFDPETYDMVVRTKVQMAGYDFDTKGNLYTGDILFSFGSPDQWSKGEGNFSHIFMVAGIDENNARLAVTNMVKNHLGVKDCFIREVDLYTPGDLQGGVINYEWNNHGYGITGKYGFDVFRWKWITHHLEVKTRQYEVRWGETIETIGFDWKISPASIMKANQFPPGVQLVPGQAITLPAPPND